MRAAAYLISLRIIMLDVVAEYLCAPLEPE